MLTYKKFFSVVLLYVLVVWTIKIKSGYHIKIVKHKNDFESL